MGNIISVVTPVHGEGAKFLPEAYASLRSQDLPDGWSWEWCVQEDGSDVGASAHLPANDPRIRVSASRRGGPHVARTLAFARSTGAYVKNLDADDQLTAGALARDIAVLEERPLVGWTTSRVVDLLEDGSTVSFEGDPEPGRLPRGSAYGFWAEHRRPPVHPATLCVRRPLLALLGGWMALPASGDTGLLLGLDALADGWFIGDTGLMYRKHPGQITTHPHHRAGVEWEARMSLIEERAKALRAWAGTGTGPTGTGTGPTCTGTGPTCTGPTGTGPTGTEPTGTEPTCTELAETEPTGIGTEPTCTEPEVQVLAAQCQCSPPDIKGPDRWRRGMHQRPGCGQA